MHCLHVVSTNFATWFFCIVSSLCHEVCLFFLKWIKWNGVYDKIIIISYNDDDVLLFVFLIFVAYVLSQISTNLLLVISTILITSSKILKHLGLVFKKLDVVKKSKKLEFFKIINKTYLHFWKAK